MVLYLGGDNEVGINKDKDKDKGENDKDKDDNDKDNEVGIILILVLILIFVSTRCIIIYGVIKSLSVMLPISVSSMMLL